MKSEFDLDGRLETDSVFIADGPLSQFRLMRDARYPWLVLVPRIPAASEWIDLPPGQQQTLLSEINVAGTILRNNFQCEKINIGALGNIVRQLHVHVIARTSKDEAWPGPVWGQGASKTYMAPDLDALVDKLRKAIETQSMQDSPAQ